MGRGNDAIPTWSGFNYQGRVMLLRVIEDMNSLLTKGEDLDGYSVELEKIEDFSLIKGKQYLSLYQVKAYPYTCTVSTFAKALEKLLEHRKDTGYTSAKCYLVTPMPISDWNVKSNKYKKNVELYKYGTTEVKIDKVKEHTLLEINKLLANIKQRATNIEAVYGNLCLYIDEKVAEMHLQGNVARKYTLSYKSFETVILDSLSQQDEAALYLLKEAVYKYMLDTIDNSINDICMNKCANNYKTCGINCAAKKAYDYMLSLSNLRKYCKVINADKVNDWGDELAYTSNFNKKDVENFIFQIFAMCKSPTCVERSDNVVGVKLDKEEIQGTLTIPTLIQFKEAFKDIYESMSNKLQKINQNTDIFSEVLGNTIVVDGKDGSSKSLSGMRINQGWNDIKSDSVENIPRDIYFITFDEIIDYLDSGV